MLGSFHGTVTVIKIAPKKLKNCNAILSVTRRFLNFETLKMNEHDGNESLVSKCQTDQHCSIAVLTWLTVYIRLIHVVSERESSQL